MVPASGVRMTRQVCLPTALIRHARDMQAASIEGLPRLLSDRNPGADSGQQSALVVPDLVGIQLTLPIT
jgi:hypothetical protein